jgi:hypothetical protein
MISEPENQGCLGRRSDNNPFLTMKKLSTISVFVSTAALAGICGCASNSSNGGQSAPPAQTSTTTTTTTTQTTQTPPPKPKDKRPIEQRLVVGMTMDQVKDACGNPRSEAMNSDGSATWMYGDAEKAFIPNYMLFGGKIHHVTIFFDTGGRVKSWAASDSGNY